MSIGRAWLLEMVLAAVAVVLLVGMTYYARKAQDSNGTLLNAQTRLAQAERQIPAGEAERLDNEIADLRANPPASSFPDQKEVERRLNGLEPIIRSPDILLVAITQDEHPAQVSNADVAISGDTPSPRPYLGTRLNLQAQGQAGPLMDLVRAIRGQFQDPAFDQVRLVRLEKPVDTYGLTLTTVLYYRPDR